MDKLLEGKILNYKDGDPYDIKLSYSGLELFEQCPYRYMIKYNKGMRTEQQTIALEVGSICHKVLELKADMLSADPSSVDYEYLYKVLQDGYVGTNVSDDASILGIEDIKNKYGEEAWLVRDEGTNYEEKLKLFRNDVILNEVPWANQKDWTIAYSEMPFNFIYVVETPYGVKRILFNGFIDRVDYRRKDNKDEYEIRVVDYKTSKKVYDSRKLSTPLQMIIYGMAIAEKTGNLPVEYQYSFILLDERANACTKGYLKRGINKIDKLLTELFEKYESGYWEAKGTPLCYWCEFNRQGTVHDKKLMNECERFCLWTPENKTFDCVDPWTIDEKLKPKETKINYADIVRTNGTIVNGRIFGW